MTSRRPTPFASGLILALLVALPCEPDAGEAVAPATVASTAHPAKSPVGLFRELLNLSPDERELKLAERSPEFRRRLQAKLDEYAAMPPDQREVRLRATELRWLLVPLMKTPPAQRGEALDRLSADLRGLVEARLKHWDILPPSIQNELMEHELAIHYFAQLEGRTPEQQKNLLENLSPRYRSKIETELANWHALPQDQRSLMFSRFNQFFELTSAEKDRILDELAGPERRRTEQITDSISRLPREKREQYIDAFRKFAAMPAAEQAQFLKNAERWEGMSENERAAWRELVAKVPPPPASIDPRLAPLPQSIPPVATNSAR